MTAPADIALYCGSQLHEFGPFAPAPEAEFWIDWHGCLEGIACAGCLTNAVEQAAKRFDHEGELVCGHCHRTFTNPFDYLTWIDITPKDH